MHDYDKSCKWIIQHHGGSILRLAGVHGVVSWRPLQAEVVQPRQLPDGLLEVEFAATLESDLFILELATYPEDRLYEQIARDMMLVWLDQRKLPEVVAIILHPRGNLRIANELSFASPQGLSRCALSWRVVELWNVPADELLAAGDVGLIPWVPLARHSEPVEKVLQACRDRIDRDAPANDRENLLAVTQIMTRLRYNDESLLSILGGGQMMLEFPFIQEIVAKRGHRDILKFLSTRFGPVPVDISERIASILDEEKLDELVELSASCLDWDDLRARLPE